MIVLFFATADWRQPWRSARPLLVATVTVALAFGALYYLEQYRYEEEATQARGRALIAGVWLP